MGRMFGEEELRRFTDDGYVVLRGAVDDAVTAAMRERLWSLLAGRGVTIADPSTWALEATTHLQSLRKGDPAPHDAKPVRAVFDGVFGADGWKSPRDWGQVLFTLPSPPPWAPHVVWHLDHPFLQRPGSISGINAFLFVDDVVPRGGGTLALRSSPQLVGRFVRDHADAIAGASKTKRVRARFERWHPSVGELLTAAGPRLEQLLDDEGECTVDVGGIAASVVELTGAAGDVVVCHPWLLHSPGANVSHRARLMRAARIYRVP
jgi:hypothetical protein